MPLRERLEDRAAGIGFTLSEEEASGLERYLRLLERWNRTINLTALPLAGFPDPTLDRLVIEPLIAARLVADDHQRWLDLGSGGGSPAIPLKIVRPRRELTMIEAKSRKAAFLREAIRDLGLEQATVVASRLQELQLTPGSADLVSMRGVKVDETMLGAAVRLLRPGGRLLLFRGRRQEHAAGCEALRPCREVELPGGGRLEVWEKGPDR
jgi:16S rRNA (guanine527-N7)-methyltransferase